MHMIEFKLYRDQRIKDLREAYIDDSDQNSEDSTIRESWLRLRRNWNSHADAVITYASEEDLSGLMDCWRAIIRDGRYSNEHEGIGLNVGLTSENINEILAVSQADPNMYWITRHLKNHPNSRG
jgi:hypothetical protein